MDFPDPTNVLSFNLTLTPDEGQSFSPTIISGLGSLVITGQLGGKDRVDIDDTRSHHGADLVRNVQRWFIQIYVQYQPELST